jgi:ubiquinone/menaquinone biosynthesis C-methylase UbiE
MYFRFFLLLLSGKVVKKEDYKEEYNEISETYNIWTEKMKCYSNEILRIDLLDTNKEIKILDFACGTGYFTRNLLNNIDNRNLRITAVDISEKMLKVAREEIADSRCEFILQDGMSFLEKEQKEKYDAIYCGFALPYFNQKKIIKQWKRVLKTNGTLHLITNCKGTLEGIYEIYLELMKSNPFLISKIMEIRSNLPRSEKSLNAWFSKYKFDTIIIDTINEWVIFDTPRKLFEWLKQTGAIAGTGKIFTNQKQSEERIIKKIEETLCFENQYRVNHKFILGVFQKSSKG